MELGRGQITFLSWGDPVGVPVSRACPKGGAVHAKVTRCQREVSRGDSRRPMWPAKGTSKYVLSSAHVESFHRIVTLDLALAAVQWLESSRQRDELKLVLNRRMRTRMYTVVREAPRSNPGPCPDRDGYPLFHHASKISNSVRRDQCNQFNNDAYNHTFSHILNLCHHRKEQKQGSRESKYGKAGEGRTKYRRARESNHAKHREPK